MAETTPNTTPQKDRVKRDREREKAQREKAQLELERANAYSIAFDGGSTKQQIRLYFSELDRQDHQQPTLLTQDELEHFGNSLSAKTIANRRWYYNNIKRSVRDTQEALRIVLRNWFAFKGYIDRWAAVEAIEEAVNIALLAIPQLDERKKAATVIANRTTVVGCSQIVEASGLLHFTITDTLGDEDVESQLKVGRDVLTYHFGQLKAILKATLDCIDSYGLGMPETKKELKEIEETLTDAVMVGEKYNIQPETKVDNDPLYGAVVTGLYGVLPNYATVPIDNEKYIKHLNALHYKE